MVVTTYQDDDAFGLAIGTSTSRPTAEPAAVLDRPELSAIDGVNEIR
ncbi:hypothetical protein AB0J72_34310 [Dactylosporangium sp. NPDC049742]